MARNRLGALRTMATAVRAATRPGSPGFGERLASLPRLFRATFRGEYAGTTRGRLLMVLGAVAYVVSPIDLVPELALSVFGLADDAVVVSWIAATVVNETESFLAWERSTPSTRGTGDGGAGDGGAGPASGSSASHETVRGTIV
jgi:uncharacterized membrane protein YkvA (DUF1232 family)